MSWGPEMQVKPRINVLIYLLLSRNLSVYVSVYDIYLPSALVMSKVNARFPARFHCLCNASIPSKSNTQKTQKHFSNQQNHKMLLKLKKRTKTMQEKLKKITKSYTALVIGIKKTNKARTPTVRTC